MPPLLTDFNEIILGEVTSNDQRPGYLLHRMGDIFPLKREFSSHAQGWAAIS